MNILKLFMGAKFDHDQVKEKMLLGTEIFKFFVSDHLNAKSNSCFIQNTA